MIIGPMVEYQRLQREEAMLQYEQIIAQNYYNDVTEQLNDLAEYKDQDPSILESEIYQDLLEYQTEYDTKLKLNDTMLEQIGKQKESFQKLVSNGVKEGFGLKFSGG